MSQDGIEIRREGEVEFSKPLARALFRDSRLSFSARGLFAFLWDLPADWFIRSQWLAKRGPEGRDAIRARLSELRQVGALRIEAIRGQGGKVAGTRWVLVTPEKWAKSTPLAEFTESRISRLSVLPTVGEPATKVHQGSKGLQEEAAAPRAKARGPADAAAAGGKVRTARVSGIVTWTSSDVTAATELEQQHDAAAITVAVDAVRAANKEPVPGLVAREIERARVSALADERRAAADTAYVERLKSSTPGNDSAADLAAKERGRQLLAQRRSKATPIQSAGDK